MNPYSHCTTTEAEAEADDLSEFQDSQDHIERPCLKKQTTYKEEFLFSYILSSIGFLGDNHSD